MGSAKVRLQLVEAAMDADNASAYDSDDSITITITESGDEETNTYSDPEDEYSCASPNDNPTIEWLQYENARLRSTIPQLKQVGPSRTPSVLYNLTRQAISTRDLTIKTMRRDAKKAAAITKRHKSIIMDINKELAEAHKELLMLKGEITHHETAAKVEGTVTEIEYEESAKGNSQGCLRKQRGC